MSQTSPRGWLRLSGPALIAGGLGVLALLALTPQAPGAVWMAGFLTVLVLVVAWRAARITDLEAKTPPAPTRPPHENAPPYVSIINALPDPVLVIAAHEPDDLTGRRFVMVNDAARDLLRIQYDAGLLVTAIRDPEVLEAVDEALFGGLDSQAVYEMGGAQARVLKAFAKPLGEAPDGSRLALLVLRDETDVRRAEQTRADFLANASHELRTPLASLTGFIETLRGHARTDEGAREKFLTIMSTQAERMARLIDDLLSLSRIELNEHIAPQGETDLASAVMDVVDALGPLARERGVTLAPCLPPRGGTVVSGDRDQIVQVAQNLVDNALKYAPRGSTVRIALASGLTAEAAAAPLRAQSARLSLLTPDHGPDLYAALRVSDEGLGLKREHRPRRTERFYRVEGQTSGARSGTGLGLAIVKHIMNRHRGGLAVESVEGEGATFSAYFPLVPGSLTLPEPPTPDAVIKVS